MHGHRFPFDLYSLSEVGSGVDVAGSPVKTIVRLFSDATGVFVNPGSKVVREWFGYEVVYDVALLLNHGLSTDPVGGVSIFDYLSVDEYPNLYIVITDILSTYYGIPWWLKEYSESTGAFGLNYKGVCLLVRPAPDQQVRINNLGELEVI